MKKAALLWIMLAFMLAFVPSVFAQGGDLVIAVPAELEPASLDGHTDPYQNTWLFDSFSADSLIVMDSEGGYQPCLAESYETSEDGLTWTFKLKQGVKFQDGTDFNAEAVKYNFERVFSPEIASVQMADELGVSVFESAEVIDEYTIAIHYSSPWVGMLAAICRFPIWSPTACKKYGISEFDKHLVGTGPFILEEVVASDHVKWTKWADYGGWNPLQDHEGAAYLDSVTVRYIGESMVLGDIVNNEEAHIAMNLPYAYVEDYEDNEDAYLVEGFQGGTGMQWVFNTRSAPLDNVEVRQALLYLTDQDDLNETVFDGLYLTQHGPLTSIHPCYWDGAEDMYLYDADKAIELLEKNGWILEEGAKVRTAKGVEGVEDGTPLKITMSILGESRVSIGEYLQLQWAEGGVDLELELIPGTVQIERVNNHDFQLMYERQRTPDPRVISQVWNSKYDVEGGWAWSGLKNEELDALCDDIETNTNYEERCEEAKRAQEIIMENAAMVPLVGEPCFYAVDADVSGFFLASEGNWFYLNNVKIAE